MDSSEPVRMKNLWPLGTLQPLYVEIIAIERYICQDSVVVVFTTETGYQWAVLTLYN